MAAAAEIGFPSGPKAASLPNSLSFMLKSFWLLLLLETRHLPFFFFLSVKYKYNPPFYFSRFVGMGLKMELNFRDLCLSSLNLVLLSQVELR